MESVKEYVQQSSNVLALHSQIQSCDMILARMQEMLLGFQVRMWVLGLRPVPPPTYTYTSTQCQSKPLTPRYPKLQ